MQECGINSKHFVMKAIINQKYPARKEYLIYTPCMTIFCAPCLLFNEKLNPRIALASSGFNPKDYVTLNKHLVSHEVSNIHITSYQKFQSMDITSEEQELSFELEELSVKSSTCTITAEAVARNRYIVDTVLKCIMFCVTAGNPIFILYNTNTLPI